MNYLLKICGITNVEDAEMVLSFSETKPEYLGFIFFKKSSRYITPEKAGKIVQVIKKKYGKNRVKFVGVFVNESLNNSEIFKKFSFLDVFQLHGDNSFETPNFCMKLQNAINKNNKHTQSIWKAFRVKNTIEIEQISNYIMIDTVLIDAFSTIKNEYGGSGKQVCVNLLPHLSEHIASHQKFFIAGGITVNNRNKILKLSGADGIDLSSSVEVSAGIKSEKKMKEFFFQQNSED